MILTFLYFYCVNVFEVLRKVTPKDKSVFVMYQNVKKMERLFNSSVHQYRRFEMVEIILDIFF